MLGKLCGEGWQFVEPPELNDEPSVVARYEGEPVKAGVMIEELQDSPDVAHLLYRSGQYNLEVKIDFDIGRGRVKVEQAPGYGNENK